MVTVKKKQSALSDRRAMLVRLEDYGSDGSWFCVNPFYKHRKTGDPVGFCAAASEAVSVDESQTVHKP